MQVCKVLSRQVSSHRLTIWDLSWRSSLMFWFYIQGKIKRLRWIRLYSKGYWFLLGLSFRYHFLQLHYNKLIMRFPYYGWYLKLPNNFWSSNNLSFFQTIHSINVYDRIKINIGNAHSNAFFNRVGFWKIESVIVVRTIVSLWEKIISIIFIRSILSKLQPLRS